MTRIYKNRLYLDSKLIMGGMPANDNFDQTFIMDMAGPGNFNESLNTADFILGGDFTGLTAASISKSDISQVRIRLTGKFIKNTWSGTTTLDPAGWNGPGGTKSLTMSINVYEIMPITILGLAPDKTSPQTTETYGGLQCRVELIIVIIWYHV